MKAVPDDFFFSSEVDAVVKSKKGLGACKYTLSQDVLMGLSPDVILCG